MGRWVKNPKIDSGALTVEIPHVTTSQRPAGKTGQLIYNTTTSTYQSFIGSQWYNISTAAAEKTLVVDVFQGDGSTTVFGNGSGNTLDGSTAASLSVVPDSATDMIIFVGGVAQIPGINYTYSGGQITFGSAPPGNDGLTNGHVISIIHNLQKLGE
jgi:hypothetical protein